MGSQQVCRAVLDAADVRVGGDRPWDIHVHDESFFDRVLGQGALGLGESYMDGLWDCDSLDEMTARTLTAGGEALIERNWRTALHALRARVLNLQTSVDLKERNSSILSNQELTSSRS